MYQFKHTKEVKLPIPDDQKQGIKDTLKVNRSGTLEDVEVEVDITHPYVGDLKITLWSPGGQEIVLLNRKGGKKAFKKMTFGLETMSALVGTSIKGKWSLQVNDFAPRDAGTFDSWSLSLKAKNKEASVGKVEVDIPDNKKSGLVSQCEFKEDGLIDELKVSLNIQHGYVGDLTASITSPSGKTAVLHNRAGGNQKNLKTSYKGMDTKVFAGQSLKGIWKLKVVDHQVRDQGSLKAWGIHVKLDENSKDDLTKVEGIGPKIAGLFNQAGIHSFLDLSKTSVKKMKDILDAAGPRYRTHQPDTWAQQAGMAALGDWKALKKWQDELDGGR